MKKMIGILLFCLASTMVMAKNANNSNNNSGGRPEIDNGKAKEPEDNGLPYLITTAVFPLDKDFYEITVQPQYTAAREEHDLFLYTILSYGVTDSWQVYFDMYPYVIHTENGQDTSGFGDMDFGTQYSWMYINKSTLSAGFLFNIHVPTGDVNRNLTDGFMRYEPSLLLAKDIVHPTWRTQFFTQIGLSIVHRLKEPDLPEEERFELEPAAHSLVWNSGVAIRTEKVNYSLELNWYVNSWNNSGDNNELYVTPGVYLQIRKYVAIGFGAPIGLTHDAAPFSVLGTVLVDIPGPCAKTDDDDDNDKNDDDKDEKVSKLNKKLKSKKKLNSKKSRPHFSGPHSPSFFHRMQLTNIAGS